MGERHNRSARSGENSSGIGLSIVQSVAAAFGGTMEITQDGQGFRIALVLPAARDTA